MWKIINNVLGRNKKDRLPDFFIKADGNKISDVKSIAENFNTFFANIGSNLAKNIPEPSKDFISPVSHHSTSSSIFFHPTSADELVQLTSKLKTVVAAVMMTSVIIFSNN